MFNKILAYDYHVAGEPARVVVSGLPHLTGLSSAERFQEAKIIWEPYRCKLLHEPRGHAGMFGVLLDYRHAISEIGLVFCDQTGFLPMCVHGSMAAAYAAYLGIIPSVKSKKKQLVFSTSAGKIEATIPQKQPNRVTLNSVPSWVISKDRTITIPYQQNQKIINNKIVYDLISSGNNFALVDVDQLGVEVEPRNIELFLSIGARLLQQLNSTQTFCSSEKTHNTVIHLIMFYKKMETNKYKTVTVLGEKQFDRSPCGTGTAALMTLLASKGRFTLCNNFISMSIIGTTFTGRLKNTDVKAVFYPEITGNVFSTAKTDFLYESMDPFPLGIDIYEA